LKNEFLSTEVIIRLRHDHVAFLTLFKIMQDRLSTTPPLG